MGAISIYKLHLFVFPCAFSDFCCKFPCYLFLMRMSDSTAQLPRITDGTNLILRKLNSTRLIQVRMRKNAGVTVENLKFKLGEALLGKNFGIYNVKNGVLADEATDEGKGLV